MVVVKTLIHRTFGSAGKKSVSVLCKLGTASSAQSQAHLHAIGFGRLYLKPYITLRVYLGVVLPRLVKAGRFEVLRNGGTCSLSLRETADQSSHHRKDYNF